MLKKKNREAWCNMCKADRCIDCLMREDGIPTNFLVKEGGISSVQTIAAKEDVVNHPKHYTSHPSGIECIQVAEHMGFNLGNALKYIWRCDLKRDTIEDLKKAIWYINRELEKREGKK